MSDLPILDILRCPASVTRPEPDAGRLVPVGDRWLVCMDCGRKYPIRDRIPVLLIEEGDKYRDMTLEQLSEHTGV